MRIDPAFSEPDDEDNGDRLQEHGTHVPEQSVLLVALKLAEIENWGNEQHSGPPTTVGLPSSLSLTGPRVSWGASACARTQFRMRFSYNPYRDRRNLESRNHALFPELADEFFVMYSSWSSDRGSCERQPTLILRGA